MPRSCKDAERKYHAIYPSPVGEIAETSANYGGTIQVGPFAMNAGEYQTFSLTLAHNNKRPADWSVVAWGETGQVYVYNADGSETQHWARGPSMKKFGVESRP